jgi:hypothetical protein
MRAIGHMPHPWAMARYVFLLVEISSSETSASKEHASVNTRKMFANAHPSDYFLPGFKALDSDVPDANQAL